MNSNIVIFLLTALTSYFFTSFLINPLIKFMPDIPNHRSSHSEITPKGGGIAIIISSSLAFILIGQYEFLFLSFLALTCFIDDKKPIKIKYKFFSQLLTVLILFLNSNIKDNLFQTNNIFINTFLFFLIILVGCTIVNFSNFIDGIDGLLCANMLIIFSFSSIFFSFSIYPLIGSLLGFFVLNWSPAKIFLGDVGSNYLGAYLVFIVFNTNSLNLSFNLLLIISPLFLDCTICIFKRILDKQNIFKAHSSHLFQRLVKAGWKHSKVTILYSFLSLGIGISLILGGQLYEIIFSIISLITLNLIDKFYAEPFKNIETIRK